MSRKHQPFEAVSVEGLAGKAPVLFLCEHASRRFPEAFGTLGLSAEIRQSHAAWDPGALDVARLMARDFRAPLVFGAVSRLLYDCNRPPEAEDAIPAQSEVYEIPGNRGLSEAERAVRLNLIYRPFREAVARAIETAQPKAIVTVHSFTPVYFGKRRAVEVGVLHDSDSRLAETMLAAAASAGFRVERNQPYGPEDGVTHSLRIHAISRGLLNVMIEIRNDLIADSAGQARIAGALCGVLKTALADCGVSLEETS